MRRLIYAAFVLATAFVGYLYFSGNGARLPFPVMAGYAVVCLLTTWAWRAGQTESNVSEMYSRYDRPGQSKVPTYHE